jgi:hypothetical protein
MNTNEWDLNENDETHKTDVSTDTVNNQPPSIFSESRIPLREEQKLEQSSYEVITQPISTRNVENSSFENVSRGIMSDRVTQISQVPIQENVTATQNHIS